jgi:hypothetical protein
MRTVWQWVGKGWDIFEAGGLSFNDNRRGIGLNCTSASSTKNL